MRRRASSRISARIWPISPSAFCSASRAAEIEVIAWSSASVRRADRLLVELAQVLPREGLNEDLDGAAVGCVLPGAKRLLPLGLDLLEFGGDLRDGCLGGGRRRAICFDFRLERLDAVGNERARARSR